MYGSIRTFSQNRLFVIGIILFLVISGCSSASDSNGPVGGGGGDYDADGDIPSDGDGYESPDLGPKKKIALFFEHNPDFVDSEGQVYVTMIRNFLGHFHTEVDYINLDDYRAGDLHRYHAGIYFGMIYDWQLPQPFLKDVHNSERPFLWINYNVWQLASQGDLGERFGFRYVKAVEDSHYDVVAYHNFDLQRDEYWDRYFNEVSIENEDSCESLATISSSEDDVPQLPYLIHCGNFWYMADNPLLLMRSKYLVLTDMLHDFLGTKTPSTPKRRALFRFEDIAPGNADLPMLREQAETLHSMNIPFSIGVIPVFKDPEGLYHDPGYELRMRDDRNFIDTLDYLRSIGGTLIDHGYTHQYDGISGVDYEFWDEVNDAPVPEDSWEWMMGRIDAAIDEFDAAMGFHPDIWETPHYSASMVDYFALATRFDTIYERLNVYNDIRPRDNTSTPDEASIAHYTADTPYMIFESHYGFAVLPENLGYMEEGGYEEDGLPNTPETKRYYAHNHKVVRDSSVSLFYHHWQPFENVLAAINYIIDEGYTFVSVYDVVKDSPPPYEEPVVEPETDGDEDSPDGDQIEYDPCPTGARDCEYGEGCHNGFCGQCNSASECRELDGCRDDGTCGPCELSSHCGEGEECRRGYCMPDKPPVWEITIDQAHWDQMMENIWDDTYHPCVLNADGRVYDNGEEIKPFGVSSRIYPKKAFRIKFPEDAEHPGYSRKINLKADYNDPSFLHSFLGFETFRRLTNAPAPRTRYIELWINGEYYGLMVEIERIGGKFLTRNGRDRNKSMYEVEVEYMPGALMPIPEEDTENDYPDHYQKKAGDETDYSDLIEFIEDILWLDYLDSGTSPPTTTTRTREVVDIDSFLQYLAVLAIIQNIDSVASNFHFSKQGYMGSPIRWEFYPWDLDISFGCFFRPDIASALCTEIIIDEWWLAGQFPNRIMVGYPKVEWGNMLSNLVLKDPEFYSQFRSYICSMIQGEFWSQRMDDLILAVRETIGDSVLADVNDMNDSIDDFIAAQEEVGKFLVERKAYLQLDVGCGNENSGQAGNIVDPEPLQCSGGVCEAPTTVLFWQKTPDAANYEWSGAMEYCDSLELGSYSDWRLPDIDELRSLVENCDDTQTNGACGITGDCAWYSCWTIECWGCSSNDSCHWDGSLDKADGECGPFWSSSAYSMGDDAKTAWSFDYRHAEVLYFGKNEELPVRCVRP